MWYYKCIIIFHQRTCYNLPPWKCSNSHCNFHAFKASEISTLRCEIDWLEVKKWKQNYLDIWCTSSQINWYPKYQIVIPHWNQYLKKNVEAHVGTRTLDPQIKSLMLYRLSYAGYMNILGKFTIFISHKTRIKIVFSVLKSRYVCPSWHFRQHNCQVTSYNWMNIYMQAILYTIVHLLRYI